MISFHGFTPRRDHLLLDPRDEKEERTTASGIIVPEQASLAKQLPRVAKVVARGDSLDKPQLSFMAQRAIAEGRDGIGSASFHKLEVDIGQWVIWDQAEAHYRVELPDEHGRWQKYILVEYTKILAEVPAGTMLLGGRNGAA